MAAKPLAGAAGGESPYGSTPVIAFVNEKGGVAKTTSCVNLSAALAQRQHRTLCIDLDPQSNATTAFGISTEEAIGREAHCLLTMPRFPLERAVMPTEIANLDIVPGTARLADCDKALVMEVGREGRLRSKLREFYRSVLSDNYDAILVDCPPSLDLLTVTALTAATHMIVPVTTKFYALKGMALLGDIVATLHEQLGASIRLLGILVTMFDKKTALDTTIYRLLKDKVEREFGDYIFSTIITKSVVVSEAEAGGLPVLLREPESSAAEAYRALADEVMGRLGADVGGAAAPAPELTGATVS
ncbi:MAG: ParA family protein [Armatimonadota bacterium]|nr:MAG: ParA family protein [Armatimonadota bacterium]